MSGLWIIWGTGFATGSMLSYLACILFCRRIFSEEASLAQFFQSKQIEAD